jgi:subtilase family serine protease
LINKPPSIGGGEQSVMPDLDVGLIKVRDATQRSAEEGIPPYVVEVTATITNRGDALADETTTRFWVRGADLDRELRIVSTPALPPGEELEVTATWDVRDRHGDYVITVTADAFSQIEEVRTDNNSASVQVTVAEARIDIAESPD